MQTGFQAHEVLGCTVSQHAYFNEHKGFNSIYSSMRNDYSCLESIRPSLCYKLLVVVTKVIRVGG